MYLLLTRSISLTDLEKILYGKCSKTSKQVTRSKLFEGKGNSSMLQEIVLALTFFKGSLQISTPVLSYVSGKEFKNSPLQHPTSRIFFTSAGIRRFSHTKLPTLGALPFSNSYSFSKKV